MMNAVNFMALIKCFDVAEVEKSCLATWLCQAYRQLLSIPSRQFCVRLASGGDPTYAFNVRLTGEEVHGTST